LAELADLVPAAELTLDGDLLDAVDASVPSGTNLNPGDAGWVLPLYGCDPAPSLTSSSILGWPVSVSEVGGTGRGAGAPRTFCEYVATDRGW